MFNIEKTNLNFRNTVICRFPHYLTPAMFYLKVVKKLKRLSLVTFTAEIFNEKLHFLYSGSSRGVIRIL